MKSDDTKYTLGPWQINSGHRGAFYITAPNGVAIAMTYEPQQSMLGLIGAKNTEANAVLIVAAPEMLAALLMVRDANGDNKHFPAECMTVINAAISKAAGAA